jgi:hypothetical protein
LETGMRRNKAVIDRDGGDWSVEETYDEKI